MVNINKIQFPILFLQLSNHFLQINNNESGENKDEDEKAEDEKVVDISKKKVVSGEVASRFVRGADLRTVKLTDMHAAL